MTGLITAAALPIAAILAWLPVLWAVGFLRGLRRSEQVRACHSNAMPESAVILPLRGADPFLENCLTGLLGQDAPRFHLHIVIDSPDDPAWSVVTSVLARSRAPNVTVHVDVLRDVQNGCSLKLSAQRQALAQLDPAVEVVAFIDADASPARDWLRRLAAPLADPAVGASTGIRWYDPPDERLGTVLRYLTNCVSVLVMHRFHIPWGGSFAIRRDLLKRAGLPDIWRHSFCEDVSTSDPLRKLGLRVELVPGATQFNAETTDLRGAFHFFRRQLLCVRLHHGQWPSILALNLANAAALLGFAGMLIGALATSMWSSAAIAAAVLAVYLAGMSVTLRAVEVALYRCNGRTAPRLRLQRCFAAVPALIFAAAAMIAAAVARRVRWRGVTYGIGREGGIRLREYRPYRERPAAADTAI